MMQYIINFIQDWGYLAMFIAMVLENANIPIPSEIVLGFAGYLVVRGIFDFTTAIIVGTIAGIVGSILSYYLGEYGGRPLLLKYGKYIFFNEKKFYLAEKLFDHYGGAAVFIGRLLPGVRTFISFPAGIARYPMGKFILWTVIGTIPWTVLLIWLGKVLGDHWEDLIAYGHVFLYITAAGLMVLGIVALWYFKSKKGRKKLDNIEKE